MLDT
ncbi:hypothetical protein [Plasmodium yoelii yoelii]|jgi:hypothetical protein